MRPASPVVGGFGVLRSPCPEVRAGLGWAEGPGAGPAKPPRALPPMGGSLQLVQGMWVHAAESTPPRPPAHGMGDGTRRALQRALAGRGFPPSQGHRNPRPDSSLDPAADQPRDSAGTLKLLSVLPLRGGACYGLGPGPRGMASGTVPPALDGARTCWSLPDKEQGPGVGTAAAGWSWCEVAVPGAASGSRSPLPCSHRGWRFRAAGVDAYW